LKGEKREVLRRSRCHKLNLIWRQSRKSKKGKGQKYEGDECEYILEEKAITSTSISKENVKWESWL